MKIEVGTPVTELYWSDRQPFEVIKVIDDRHLLIRELDAKRIDNNGMSDCQQYTYSSNPDNVIKQIFLTKKGQWRERIGRRLGCNTFAIGYAEKYFDYSF